MTDSEKTTSESDQQLNLVISGSASAGGLEMPVNLGFSHVRVGNHLVVVAFGDDEGVGLVDPLTEIAVSRLVSVMAGEEPTDETVEAASSGSGPT